MLLWASITFPHQECHNYAGKPHVVAMFNNNLRHLNKHRDNNQKAANDTIVETSNDLS